MQAQPTNLRAAEKASTTRPTYLYHFVHGETHYYLTNLDQNVTTTGTIAQTWQAVPVGHELGDGSAELSQRTATVVLGILDTEFRRYFLTAPTKRATVEIYRVNSGSLPGPIGFDANCYMEFSGVALGPSFVDAAISITFASELAQEDRAILRFNYQPQCNHIIYGGGCHVDRDLHKVEVASVTLANRANRCVDVTITDGLIPNNAGGTYAMTAQSFEGGYLKEVATGNLIGIVSTTLLTSSTLRLFLQWWPTTMLAGVAVTLYKGCRHTFAGCGDDFGNLQGQYGVITDLHVDGTAVAGTVPLAWRAFAARHTLCVPLYNGGALGTGAWTFTPSTGVFRHLLSSDVTAGCLKLPRIGGFGGFPFIPVENPSIDGVAA